MVLSSALMAILVGWTTKPGSALRIGTSDKHWGVGAANGKSLLCMKAGSSADLCTADIHDKSSEINILQWEFSITGSVKKRMWCKMKIHTDSLFFGALLSYLKVWVTLKQGYVTLCDKRERADLKVSINSKWWKQQNTWACYVQQINQGSVTKGCVTLEGGAKGMEEMEAGHHPGKVGKREGHHPCGTDPGGLQDLRCCCRWGSWRGQPDSAGGAWGDGGGRCKCGGWVGGLNGSGIPGSPLQHYVRQTDELQTGSIRFQ